MKTKQGAAVMQLKALEETGEFSGYGSVFGNVDSYGEIVMPGAFKRSLAEHRRNKTRPKMFWQHNPSAPIGSWTELAEDDHGLVVTGKLNMDVRQGAEAYALLKAGDIDGLSIGYRVVKSVDDEEAGTVQLKELNLIEVSVVSLAANDQATVGAVKAAELEDSLARLAAGDRLQPRELEELFKEYLGFSNSEAERAVRCCLAGAQGDPAETGDEHAFHAALHAALNEDITGAPV